MSKANNFFHNDNAPAQLSRIVTAKQYQLLPQPSYSTYLALLYDFYLFANIKKWLGGKWFTPNEEIIAETEAYFANFDELYFLNDLKELEYR